MKKKTVAAMLVMCMALSATACGGSDTKETKTETTQDTGDKKILHPQIKNICFGSQTGVCF
ncbi:MAG: hypothetical protein ACLTTJ_04535 [Blautia sp.]